MMTAPRLAAAADGAAVAVPSGRGAAGKITVKLRPALAGSKEMRKPAMQRLMTSIATVSQGRPIGFR